MIRAEQDGCGSHQTFPTDHPDFDLADQCIGHDRCHAFLDEI